MGVHSRRDGCGFYDESASECVDDLDDGAEARVAFPVEAFVEAFASDAGLLGDLSHAARLGYVSYGCLHKRWIAGFRRGVEIRNGVLLAFNVFAGVEFADVYHCPSLTNDASISCASSVLPGFVSAREQEHDPTTFLVEVDAVARTEEETQFIDALAYWMHVADRSTGRAVGFPYQALYPVRYRNANAVLKTSSTLQCASGMDPIVLDEKTGPV